MRVSIALAALTSIADADPLRTPDVVCAEPAKGKIELLAGTAPFVESQRAGLDTAIAAECERAGWKWAVGACFGRVRDAEAAWSCAEQLAAPVRDRLEAAIARVVPTAVEASGGKVEIKGRIVFSSDRVAVESEDTIDQIAKLLSRKPNLSVEVHVHGEAKFETKRTQARADAIKLLLLDRLKLPANRITALGHGDTVPLGSNQTAHGRATNRRVEITYRTDLDQTAQVDAPAGDVRPPTANDLAGYLPALPGRGSKLRATIDITEGTLTCELFSDRAPMTVANFVGLATGQKPFIDPNSGASVKRRFYDGLTFHRVIPGFMIQGGDPLGSGVGGPGYRFADEIHDANQVGVGSLVMANSGANTNGSQFFVSEVRSERLDKGFTVFGRCTPISVVKKVAGVPRGSMDKPVTPVVIRKVTITRVP